MGQLSGRGRDVKDTQSIRELRPVRRRGMSEPRAILVSSVITAIAAVLAAVLSPVLTARFTGGGSQNLGTTNDGAPASGVQVQPYSSPTALTKSSRHGAHDPDDGDLRISSMLYLSDTSQLDVVVRNANPDLDIIITQMAYERWNAPVYGEPSDGGSQGSDGAYTFGDNSSIAVHHRVNRGTPERFNLADITQPYDGGMIMLTLTYNEGEKVCGAIVLSYDYEQDETTPESCQ